MTDYSELKRLAETATPGPWECREADGSAAICHAHGWVADDFSEQALVDTRYMAAANPTAVLALIADNEKLAEDYDKAWRHDLNDKNNIEAMVGELAGAQAMLETAYSERDRLKAEVEALRKDAMRYRWLRVKQTFIWLIQDWFPKDNVLTDVDAEIDAAMSKESGHD